MLTQHTLSSSSCYQEHSSLNAKCVEWRNGHLMESELQNTGKGVLAFSACFEKDAYPFPAPTKHNTHTCTHTRTLTHARTRMNSRQGTQETSSFWGRASSWGRRKRTLHSVSLACLKPHLYFPTNHRTQIRAQRFQTQLPQSCRRKESYLCF